MHCYNEQFLFSAPQEMEKIPFSGTFAPPELRLQIFAHWARSWTSEELGVPFELGDQYLLREAVERMRGDLVRALLFDKVAIRVNPNDVDSDDEPLLYRAVGHGDLASFRWLKKAGANMPDIHDEQETLLRRATQSSNALMLKKLLVDPAFVGFKFRPRFSELLLLAAARRGNVDMLCTLNDNGADITTFNLDDYCHNTWHMIDVATFFSLKRAFNSKREKI